VRYTRDTKHLVGGIGGDHFDTNLVTNTAVCTANEYVDPIQINRAKVIYHAMRDLMFLPASVPVFALGDTMISPSRHRLRPKRTIRYEAGAKGRLVRPEVELFIDRLSQQVHQPAAASGVPSAGPSSNAADSNITGSSSS